MKYLVFVLCFFLIGIPGIDSHQVLAQNVNVPEAYPHPRLFFAAKDIPTLRQKAATTHAHIWQPIREFADATVMQAKHMRPLNQLPCKTRTDAPNQFSDALIPLAFSYIMTGDTDYADVVKTALLTYSSWPSWGLNGVCDEYGVDGDLIFAHLLFGSSLAYDWVFDQFTPDEHTIITTALAQRAHELYEVAVGIEHPDNPNTGGWRRTFTHNHHMVNMSALGLAALALEDEDRRTSIWRGQAIDHARLHHALLQGIQDGTWHEGTAYQTYMMGMSLPFLYNLRRLKGLDYIAHDYYRAFSRWMVYNWLPESTRTVISHGDVTWGYPLGQQNEVLSFVASEYRDRYAQWLIEQLDSIRPRTPELWHVPWYVFEFFFYDPLITPTAPNKLPRAKTFDDLSGVIWRTGWGERDLVFGFKTGAYGGRFAYESFINHTYPWNTGLNIDHTGEGVGFHTKHDDQDTNTFYLWKGNLQLTGELTGSSNDHPMYGHTSVHNTILIDGKRQIQPNGTVSTTKDTDGTLEAVYVTDDFNYLIADAVNRYRTFDAENETTPKIANRIKRHVLFVRPWYLIMIDEIAADEAHDYAWIAHVSKGAWIDGNWIRGESLAYKNDRETPDQRSHHVLGMYVLNPSPFRTKIGVDDPRKIAEEEGSLDEYEQHQGQFKTFVGKPYVRVMPAVPVNAVQFVHVLYPTTIREWAMKPEIMTLGIDQQAAGVRVLLNGTQDHLVNYGEKATLMRDEYTLSGAVASVLKDKSGTITSMFLGDGTTLSDQHGARHLITTDTPATLQVTYHEPWVRISGQFTPGSTVTVYSPHLQEVTVNGQYVNVTRQGEMLRFTVR